MWHTLSLVRHLVKVCFFVSLSTSVLSLAFAQNASPFLPSQTDSSSASTAPQSFELSGTIKASDGIKLCIYDVQAKQSHWVKVGESSNNIKVISFDTTSERAQVVINGEARSLELKKSAVSSQPIPSYIQPAYHRPQEFSPSPTPASAAVGPVRPNFTPAQQAENAKQEQESRMLVSDLLDIGMQQRKAYEEAKKKADAEAEAKGK